MAVRPAQAVRRPHREADPAARVGVARSARTTGVRERVERRALPARRCRPPDSRGGRRRRTRRTGRRRPGRRSRPSTRAPRGACRPRARTTRPARGRAHPRARCSASREPAPERSTTRFAAAARSTPASVGPLLQRRGGRSRACVLRRRREEPASLALERRCGASARASSASLACDGRRARARLEIRAAVESYVERRRLPAAARRRRAQARGRRRRTSRVVVGEDRAARGRSLRPRRRGSAPRSRRASSGSHGSAIPSPSRRVPQRSHVSGMNCIQPTAPAELGPMLRPKFDSILLIAASTCHGIPYAAPARCQSAWSSAIRDRRWRDRPARSSEGQEQRSPGVFGVSALGRTAGPGALSGTTAKTSARGRSPP